MTEEARRGLRSATTVLTGQTVNLLALLATAIALPRLLGPEPYGRFAAAQAVVSMLFVLSTLGLPAAEVRFLPPLRRSNDFASLTELASSIWAGRLLGSLGAALLCGAWLRLPAADLGVATAAAVTLFALARYLFQTTRSLLLPLGRMGAYVGLEVGQSLLFLAAFIIGYLASGIPGGFVGAAAINGLVFLEARRTVRSAIPLSITHFRRRQLAPLMRFNIFAFVAAIANSVRSWVPVWAVAAWAGPRQAAFFGLSVQILAIGTLLFSSAQQALMPILAELESLRESERLFLWHGWLARFGAAFFSGCAVIWGLVGRDLVAGALGSKFEPAVLPITLILIAAMLTVTGSANNSLHFNRQRPAVAAFNLSMTALASLVGVGLVLSGPKEPVALWAAAALAVSALVFWILATITVYSHERAWLAAGRALLLMLPAGLSWPAAVWSQAWPVRWGAAVLFTALYLVYAFGLRLLRAGEVRYLWELISGRNQS